MYLFLLFLGKNVSLPIPLKPPNGFKDSECLSILHPHLSVQLPAAALWGPQQGQE